MESVPWKLSFHASFKSEKEDHTSDGNKSQKKETKKKSEGKERNIPLAIKLKQRT